MHLGLKLATATALSLAMFSGDLARLSLAPAAAEARSYRHWGGHHAYYPRHHYYRRNHVGVGDVLAGAVIIGGIAAVASAASRPREPYRDGYYGRSYQPDYRYGESRRAPAVGYGSAAGDPVDLCSRTAEREAQLRGGFARVVNIESVDEQRDGVRVRGLVETTDDARGERFTERFSCTADYARVVGFRFG